MPAAVLFGLGLGVGALGTLIGAGGGWMVVPILLFGYGFLPQRAVGTSLAVVFLNALSGSLAYMVQRRVLYKLGVAFAASTIPGVLIGAWLVQYLDLEWFSFLFGVFLLFVAAFLGRGQRLLVGQRSNPKVTEAELRSLRSPVMRFGMVISFLVGIFSSVFGVGGGIVHVPFLIVVLGIPVHAATATSHFVLAITSLTGCATFLSQGQVDLSGAASMGAGVLIGAQGGAFLSRRMRSEPIRRILAVALTIFAVRLVLRIVF